MLKASKHPITEDDTGEKLNEKKVRIYGLARLNMLEFC